jgi:hypothetical protein
MEQVDVAGSQNRPICKRCATRMMLARIMPDGPGFETRSYECPKCQRVYIERLADPLSTAKGWLSSKELEPPK